MGKRVLHFIRKNSQLKASFIKNQITHHINYEPFIVYRKKVDKTNDGGFADFDLNSFDSLDLSYNETIVEKIKYRTIRTLSKRQIRMIENFVSEKKIDICHFHYGTDCGVFYPLLQKLKVPSVVSFYGYDCSSFPRFMFNYGREYLANRVFNKVTRVLAMSEDMKKDLINAGCPENKIIVHYYGTDTKKFFFNHNYLKNNKVILLILASLVPQKGHIFLLESIKRLVKSGIDNFELRISGTGELENKLRNYVKENNLSENVTFTGVIKYGSKEMLKEYHNADIFVHPSVIAPNGDKEGIPGTIIEAMSAGLPVISTYHAAIPYIIENEKTGLLVKEWDVKGLADAIERLINDIELRRRLGQNAQKYALENLDLIEKEKELESIYDGLLIKYN